MVDSQNSERYVLSLGEKCFLEIVSLLTVVVLVVFCLLWQFPLSWCNEYKTEKQTNTRLQRYTRSRPPPLDIQQYFNVLNRGTTQDRMFPNAKATPYMTFTRHKIKLEGKHMTRLSCSATDILTKKTKKFLGIVIKHKRLKSSTFKTLVGVRKTGTVAWNGKFRWTKKLLDQPLASAKHRKPALGYGRFDLIVPEDKCLAEAGVYYCQIFAFSKKGVTTRYEKSYNLRRSRIKSCKHRSKDKTKIHTKSISKNDEYKEKVVTKTSVNKTQNFIIAGIVVVSLLIVIVSGVVVWNFALSGTAPSKKKSKIIETMSSEAKEHLLAEILDTPSEQMIQSAPRQSQMSSQGDNIKASGVSLQKRSMDKIGSGNLSGSQVLYSRAIDESRHSATGFRPSQSTFGHQKESRSRVKSNRKNGQTSGQMQSSLGNLDGSQFGMERRTQSNYDDPTLSQQMSTQGQLNGIHLSQHESSVPVNEAHLNQQRSSQDHLSGLHLSQHGSSVPLNEAQLNQQRSSQGHLSGLHQNQHGSSVPLNEVQLNQQRSSRGHLSGLYLSQHGGSVPLNEAQLNQQRSSQGHLSGLHLSQHEGSVPLNEAQLNQQRSSQGHLSELHLSQHEGSVPLNEAQLNQQRSSQGHLNGLHLSQHGDSVPLNEEQPSQYRRSVDHIDGPQQDQHSGSQNFQQAYYIENNPQSASQLRSSYIMNQNQQNSRDQFSPTIERTNSVAARRDSNTMSQSGFIPTYASTQDVNFQDQASFQDQAMANASSFTDNAE